MMSAEYALRAMAEIRAEAERILPAVAEAMQRFLLHLDGAHDVVCELCDQPKFTVLGDEWRVQTADDGAGGTSEMVICSDCDDAEFIEIVRAFDDLMGPA